MKKITSMILALVLALSLCACGASNSSSSSSSNSSAAPSAPTQEAEAKTTYKVGLCNYVSDASLDQICDNIKAELIALGDIHNVTFEIEEDNCQADSQTLDQIIANFIADDVDLMIGVATPVAMAMQAATEENHIPVVFAAVSDPIGAGLVDSLEAPGANITGSSDGLDTAAVMNLIFAADPDASTVGLLYDVGQDSSTAAIADAKAFLDAKGVKYIEKTGTTNDEVVQAAQALVSAGVNAVFNPTDNTIMTAELSIYEIFANAGVPQYTGANSFALNGAFVGYGVDYANLGEKTADMVADILVNGKDPASTPVLTFDNGTATINTETCDTLGFNLDDIKALFAPLCTNIETVETAESFS